ncbi:MAG: RsmD family RNA methyltransferase, partial [Endomicrobiia bacterium]|nr:RsmD family RNA methyltransferase [Endomicrobiia bacterium]
LDELGLSARARSVRCDATGNLEFLSVTAGGGAFDIIFMGPPYKDAEKKPLALVEPTLRTILSSKILSPSGTVIAQHYKKETTTLSTPLRLEREEKYGDSVLSFYKISG